MQITVSVPATTSNLGPGFDALGMALALRNVMHLDTDPRQDPGDGAHPPRVRIRIEGEGAGEIPVDAGNLVWRSLVGFMRSRGAEPPEDATLRLDNGVPLCGGLGGSATAIVGGAALGAALLGLDLQAPQTRAELLAWGTQMEGHPDNAAPCVLGGLIIAARDGEQIHTLQLRPPEELGLVLALPSLRQDTHELRAALPASVTLSDAVFNLSHTALLVGALCAGRLDLLGAAMGDRIHQHVRTAGMPGFEDVVQAARAAGALSCVLSGAGATVLATYDRRTGSGEPIAAAMCAAFEAAGVPCRGRVVGVSEQGLCVL